MPEPSEHEKLAKLQAATALLESYTACANADLAKFGEWQCDWSIPMRECRDRIEKLGGEQAREAEDSGNVRNDTEESVPPDQGTRTVPGRTEPAAPCKCGHGFYAHSASNPTYCFACQCDGYEPDDGSE